MGNYVQINKGLNYNNKNLLEKLKELHHFDTSIAQSFLFGIEITRNLLYGTFSTNPHQN